MVKLIRNSVKKFPLLRQVFAERDYLRAELKAYKTWVPPGHFYSPIPSLDEIRENEQTIFTDLLYDVPGIDLRTEEQLGLLAQFEEYHKDLPFKAKQGTSLRYFYENSYFSYLDAVALYCMIRHFKPRRIIEIGSGYSSCVILDTNELFFGNSISCNFIDPYPDRLKSLIRPTDIAMVEILEKKVQSVGIDKFAGLSAGDILFIDSSHVSKVYSDVNYIVFHILPHIPSGVHIHFHDVFSSFEYPKEWVYHGVAWNEAYLLRAFLQYNNVFKIELFMSFLKRFFMAQLLDAMPVAIHDPEPDIDGKNAPAGSIWLRKY